MSNSQTATASFMFDNWAEEPIVDDENLRLYRTRFRKRLHGEIEGHSVGDMLMLNVAGRPAAYCGFELVTATVAGRMGTFAFHHNAGGGLAGGLSLTVVPGSGTAQLDGLAGSARIEIAGEVGDTAAPHRLIFDYRLG